MKCLIIMVFLSLLACQPALKRYTLDLRQVSVGDNFPKPPQSHQIDTIWVRNDFEAMVKGKMKLEKAAASDERFRLDSGRIPHPFVVFIEVYNQDGGRVRDIIPEKLEAKIKNDARKEVGLN